MKITFIVATSANLGQDQLSNDYGDYVLIRRELKYIKTPVILRFDEETKICQVFFPPPKLRGFEEKFDKKSLP